jgi:hypothetical protein
MFSESVNLLHDMTTASLPFPSTETRVEQSTSDETNARIENETAANVERVAAGGPHAITRRIEELDREWDMERILEANAALVMLLTLALGAFAWRRLYGLTGFVAGFLLQHAVQGWCPPVPLFRKLRVRTAREIHLERTALRILRGDFRRETHNPRVAFNMAKENHANAPVVMGVS